MRINSLFLISICLILCSCALQDYRRATPSLNLATKERLSVGVQDRRPYILNHDKEEYFVGIQRGGFGIPTSLMNHDGRPLSEDMTEVIVKSLANTGATVTPMKITPAMENDSVFQIAKSQQADKVILLTLLNWKTDTYQSTNLVYDVSMTVYDSQGQELATKHLQGTDNLGKNTWNPQSIPIELAPIAFEKKLEELFNGNISASLSKN